MENPLEMDDLGGTTIFGNILMSWFWFFGSPLRNEVATSRFPSQPTPFGMFGLAMLRCPFAVLVSQLGGAGASLSHVCWICAFWLKDGRENESIPMICTIGIESWICLFDMGCLKFWKIMSAFSSSDRGSVPIWDTDVHSYNLVPPDIYCRSIWMQAIICHNHSFLLCFILPFAFESFFLSL